MNSAEKNFIKSLSDALDFDKHVILANSVFFHGTPIPEQGVYLDPDALEGDKWFTTYQDYAKSYAVGNAANQSADVFQMTIKENIFVAKQGGEINAATHMGRWASAVLAGVSQNYGSSTFAIEHAYIRRAIQVRFGHDASVVVGLYKPSPHSDAYDELFLLDCRQHIFNVKRVH